jgi:AraC-like DNA-binding protein
MLRGHQPVKVAAVAEAVGYESESSFGKVFKRVMGVSPGGYRHRHQGGVHEETLNGVEPPALLEVSRDSGRGPTLTAVRRSKSGAAVRGRRAVPHLSQTH